VRLLLLTLVEVSIRFCIYREHLKQANICTKCRGWLAVAGIRTEPETRPPGQKFTAGINYASEKLKAQKKEQMLLGFIPQEKGILTQRRWTVLIRQLPNMYSRYSETETVNKRYGR